MSSTLDKRVKTLYNKRRKNEKLPKMWDELSPEAKKRWAKFLLGPYNSLK